ncbi:agglutinin-2 [Cajanus cajan]|uniref:Agglutinin-2 n=1 Tax=Cajanus cajan TaxID=3821 RepID=A0A151RI75_CAJCA|nr:agglutinin-2 [Cajanus cajan]KYP42115.1 Agglutinin-2 [Cajanus cajan]
MNNSRMVHVLTTIISFLVLSQTVNSVSINFPTFTPYTNAITLEGDANVSEGAIYLTPATPYNAGRASYAAPVRLWDAQTGRLAGFNTTFSFVVGPYGPGLIGDGIAFFLGPFNSNIPQNSSGGYLGLFSSDTALNVYENQVVAVEFDSFSGNPWDPPYAHVGLDINSIASVTTEEWETGNVTNGFVAYATVSYEPVGKNLDVVVTYPGSRLNETETSLSFEIDLRTVLPEWVRIGFSGATGSLVEIHKVLSWTFNSSFY